MRPSKPSTLLSPTMKGLRGCSPLGPDPSRASQPRTRGLRWMIAIALFLLVAPSAAVAQPIGGWVPILINGRTEQAQVLHRNPDGSTFVQYVVNGHARNAYRFANEVAVAYPNVGATVPLNDGRLARVASIEPGGAIIYESPNLDGSITSGRLDILTEHFTDFSPQPQSAPTTTAPVGPLIPAVGVTNVAPVGSWVPILVNDASAQGQVLHANPDGSTIVQYAVNGHAQHAYRFGNEIAVPYPPIGSAIDLGNGRTGHVFSFNSDGTVEYDSVHNGRATSGRYDVLTQQGTDYAPRPRPPVDLSNPLNNGVTPQVAMIDGEPYTQIANILVQGRPGDPFTNQVLLDLGTIARTNNGVALFTSVIAGRGPTNGAIFIEPSRNSQEAGAGAFSHPLAEGPAPTDLAFWNQGENRPNVGTSSVVLYDPFVDGLQLPLDPDRINSSMSWGRAINMPAYVTLFHEMLHASDHLRGINGRLISNDTIDVGEERAVGLGDFRELGFTENTFRQELGLPDRPFYGHGHEHYSTDEDREFTVEEFAASHTGSEFDLFANPPDLGGSPQPNRAGEAGLGSNALPRVPPAPPTPSSGPQRVPAAGLDPSPFATPIAGGCG
ncbi:MAG TPA: M91 family zinc metallopeptidase [Polyangia bacterium]